MRIEETDKNIGIFCLFYASGTISTFRRIITSKIIKTTLILSVFLKKFTIPLRPIVWIFSDETVFTHFSKTQENFLTADRLYGGPPWRRFCRMSLFRLNFPI